MNVTLLPIIKKGRTRRLEKADGKYKESIIIKEIDSPIGLILSQM